MSRRSKKNLKSKSSPYVDIVPIKVDKTKINRKMRRKMKFRNIDPRDLEDFEDLEEEYAR